jgi:hypothetical protein
VRVLSGSVLSEFVSVRNRGGSISRRNRFFIHTLTFQPDTTMANTTNTAVKSNFGFYAFMSLMVGGFIAIFGFVIYLMFQ